jgi:hypothetical protein
MWTPEGKNGLWVWYMDDQVLQTAAQAGYHYVLVKAGDTVSTPKNWSQFNPDLVQQCHDLGLGCVAWAYAYLGDPGTEIAMGLHALDQGADGLVVDVEYEAVGRVDQGWEFVTGLTHGDRGKWLGYSPDFRIAFGNRWPSGGFNPNAEPWPWQAFNTLDGVLPQLYWTDFAQSYQTTLDMVDLWVSGCLNQGWTVPPIYPVFPSTAPDWQILGAAKYAASLGFAGANTWRWGSGSAASQMALAGFHEWSPIPSPPDEEDTVLRPYIEEMGSPTGSIVEALQRELDKPRPSKKEIQNIMNRLIAIRNEALGE